MPDAYALRSTPDELARHQRAPGRGGTGGRVGRRSTTDAARCTSSQPDRTGLLATVAGALALRRLRHRRRRPRYGHPTGIALEVFTGRDRFGRLARADARRRRPPRSPTRSPARIALDEQLRDRARRYRPADRGRRRPRRPRARRHRRVGVATVVEVHAPDDVGLLARVAAVFADLELDVDAGARRPTRRRSGRRRLLPPRHDGHRFDAAPRVESLRATLLAASPPR